MAKVTTQFADGVEVELHVRTPWWTWLWLGILYSRVEGRIRIYKVVQREVRRWWCLGLCKRTVTVREDRRADNVRMDAVIVASLPRVGEVQETSSKACNNASSCTLTWHRFAFPVPPGWGGDHLRAVGFRAQITRNREAVTLQCHWGDALVLPQTHICLE